MHTSCETFTKNVPSASDLILTLAPDTYKKARFTKIFPIVKADFVRKKT